ncbi:MAG: hypothetical protein IMZ67_01900 [Acidobacteria bacterium]|nr:hypothetical protein [Acidobacteriota bacterium]
MTIDDLLAALRGRGLELRLVVNRLRAFDAAGRYAWPELLSDEVAFIRTNRQALKRRLRDGPRDSTPLLEVDTPAPLVSPPEPCAYGCGTLARCTAMKKHNLDAWRVIHGNDPEEIVRRGREATQLMNFGPKTSPFL